MGSELPQGLSDADSNALGSRAWTWGTGGWCWTPMGCSVQGRSPGHDPWLLREHPPGSSLVLHIPWGALGLVQKGRSFCNVKPRWLKFLRLGRSVWRCPINKKKNRFSLEAKPASGVLHLLGMRPFFA